MTSKLKALGGCSSHHLQGVGAYCVGPTAGCTDCYILGEIGSGTMIQWTPVSLNWQHLAEVPSETYLDLDLVPPVPDGTLGDEISPPVSIIGSSPCTMPS